MALLLLGHCLLTLFVVLFVAGTCPWSRAYTASPRGRPRGARAGRWRGRERWTSPPDWLNHDGEEQEGVSAVEEFERDTAHWARVVKSYRTKIGVDWATVRNVMDVDAHFGG